MQFLENKSPLSQPTPRRDGQFLMASTNSYQNNSRSAASTTTSCSPGSNGDRTGRKTYKTSKEKKETVWPQNLEAALLDALALYRPKSKSGRKLRRFTKRNVFISNHILRVTGVHRTPKQVGSRLQQIRESCTDEGILRLVVCREFPSDDEDAKDDDIPHSVKASVSNPNSNFGQTPRKTPSLSSVSSSSDDLPSPIIPNPLLTNFDSAGLTVSAELLPSQDGTAFAMPLMVDAELTDRGLDIFLNLDKTRQPGDFSYFATLPQPLVYRSAPTATLISSELSPSTTYACMFCVYLDGATQVHSENIAFTPVKPEAEGDPYLYTVNFLPRFWSKFVSFHDLERYTVVQDIMEISSPAHISSPKRIGRPSSCKIKSSIAYRFKRSQSSSMYSPCSPIYTGVNFEDDSLTPHLSDLNIDAIHDANVFSAATDLPLQISPLQNEGGVSPALWYTHASYITPSSTSFSHLPTFADEQYSPLDMTYSYPYSAF